MQSPVPKSDDLDALIGSVVAGKYRVDRVLGRGGMGAVFSATNVMIGKRVALKFLTREAARDRSATARFQREAEAAGVIESEHIVHVFDSGTSEDGLPFLVMELLAGEDLRTRLQREGMLPVPQAVEVTTHVLRGLVRAHAAGIIHRDLKPDNVFLCRRDDGSVLAKIVDFGISKLSHGRAAKTLTRRGTVLGTAYYMAPEQAQAAGSVDERADLYGAGTILFEMLAGRPPHVAPTHEAVLVAICTKDAPDVRTLRPDVPAGLARLLERALARDRDARIASAEEFLEGLSGAPSPAETVRARKEPFAHTEITGSTTERRRLGTRRTVIAGIVAALLGFTLTAVLVAREKAKTRATPTASIAPSQAPGPALPSATPVVEVVPVTHTPSAAPAASASTSTRATERRARAGAGKPSEPSTRASAPGQTQADAGIGRTLTLSTREP